MEPDDLVPVDSATCVAYCDRQAGDTQSRQHYVACGEKKNQDDPK